MSLEVERGSYVTNRTLVEKSPVVARNPSNKKREHPVHINFLEGGMKARIVAISASGILFCTFGYVNAFGVFQEYYQSHQLASVSPSTMPWIGSIQIFLLFAGRLVVGPVFDRYGPIVLWPVIVAHLISIFMTGICTEVYQFILARGILGGNVMGMLNAPPIAAIGQYFNKKRSTAMGIAVVGSSIALSQMLDSSSLNFGWSIRICGFIILLLVMPATMGIKSDYSFLLPFNESLFLGIVGLVFIIIIGVFFLLFFFHSYVISNGISLRLAGHLPSIINGASFFGRVIPGITADKIGNLNTFALLDSVLPQSNAVIITFSVFYGFTYGGIVLLMSVVLAMVSKNLRDMGTCMGMGKFVIIFRALMGPPIEGAFVSHYHGFSEVSVFSGIVVIIGALAIGSTKFFNRNGYLWKRLSSKC
ncbi:monocarboxylate permease-like protein [Xylogone sp. PMI_703]|nr:monocarboxylate permease-like protein [Xylogone sp. PMI_703]